MFERYLAGYVLVTLAAAVCHGLSQALQKYGVHQQIPELQLGMLLRQPLRVIRALWTHPAWLAGLGIEALGIVLGIQALANGELTVVMPLMTLTMAIAILCGTLMFGERLRRTEWLGIAVMVGGAVGLIGSTGSPSAVVPDRLVSLAVLVAGLAVAAVLVGASRRQPASRELLYTGSAAVLVAVTDTLTKAATEQVERNLGNFVVTDPQVVLALLLEPILWMTVLTYVGGFLITQVAFAQGRVSVILPVRIMLSLLCTTTLGILLFAEPVGVHRWSAILLMFAGVFVLARRTPASSERTNHAPSPVDAAASRAASTRPTVHPKAQPAGLKPSG